MFIVFVSDNKFKKQPTYENQACCARGQVITQQKTHNLFRVDENSLEQCCAAHIVQCCQQYCSALLSLN